MSVLIYRVREQWFLSPSFRYGDVKFSVKKKILKRLARKFPWPLLPLLDVQHAIKPNITR